MESDTEKHDGYNAYRLVGLPISFLVVFKVKLIWFYVHLCYLSCTMRVSIQSLDNERRSVIFRHILNYCPGAVCIIIWLFVTHYK